MSTYETVDASTIPASDEAALARPYPTIGLLAEPSTWSALWALAALIFLAWARYGLKGLTG